MPRLPGYAPPCGDDCIRHYSRRALRALARCCAAPPVLPGLSPGRPQEACAPLPAGEPAVPARLNLRLRGKRPVCLLRTRPRLPGQSAARRGSLAWRGNDGMTDNKAWSSRQTSFVSAAGSLQDRTPLAVCPHGHFSQFTLFGFSSLPPGALRPAANVCSQDAAPGLPSGETRGVRYENN